MDTDKNKILQYFREDKNCAQAVLLGFADRFQINEDHALSVASGFGAGMGRLQKTCGAVSGAYMVIGLYAGSNSSNIAEMKENAYKMIIDFTKKFETQLGSSDCSELTRCDLKTETGQQKFEKEQVKEKVCEKCILSSISILNEIMS